MNLEDHLLIEAYLNNKLKQVDLISFEKRLKTDASFHEKVLIEKQLKETLNEAEWSFVSTIDSNEVEAYKAIYNSEETIFLKEKLKETNRGYHKNLKRKKALKLTVYTSIAAALVLFFMVFNLIDFDDVNLEKLFAESIKNTSLPSLVTRGSEKINIEDIQLAYDSKQYAKVLTLTNQENTQLNAPLYLYKGMSQLLLNKPKEAIHTFDELIQSDLLDAQKGKWFKALALLKMNNLKELKSILTEIAEKKEYNYQKAVKLLAQLD